MAEREKPPRVVVAVAARRRTASLSVARRRSALCRLSRRGMGRARIRRPRPVREARARRLSGRAVVDHHPAQAPGVPKRVRRIRSRTDRALGRGEEGGADGRRRHRAQPRQDRGDPGARAHRSRPDGQGRLRPTSVELRRRPADPAARGEASRDIPVESDESRAMAKDLRARGGNFVGPTIVYAFMQATGMVNDHLVDCCRHEACRALARDFPP